MVYEQEDPASSIQLSAAVLDSRIRTPEGGSLTDFKLLDVEFFDADVLVIAYRQGPSGK